jgi:hypothetical protein
MLDAIRTKTNSQNREEVLSIRAIIKASNYVLTVQMERIEDLRAALAEHHITLEPSTYIYRKGVQVQIRAIKRESTWTFHIHDPAEVAADKTATFDSVLFLIHCASSSAPRVIYAEEEVVEEEQLPEAA